MARPCPFCSGQVPDRICPECGRDATRSRRKCGKCGGMSPTIEASCCHCYAPFKSELRWKVPLIIGIFLAAIILSIIIQIVAR